MKTLFYFWMVFQIFIGIWLFISPFVFAATGSAGVLTNNMLFGALTVIIGVGMLLYEYYHGESRLTFSNFVYAWLAFQFAVGVWLFVSPFVLQYTGTMRFNDMLFGALLVVLGVGTSVFEFFHRERYEIPAVEKPIEQAR